MSEDVTKVRLFLNKLIRILINDFRYLLQPKKHLGTVFQR